MRNAWKFVAAAMLWATLSGCGTVNNLTVRPQVYGGVREVCTRNTGSPCLGYVQILIVPPVFLIDLSCSFVADTVLLPYTIPVELCRPATPAKM